MRAGIAGATGLLLVVGVAAGADWPQYRGADGQGIASEDDLIGAWSADGPAEAWRRPLGGGYSGIAVVGERVVTMDADADGEALVTLDAGTGETVWRHGVGPFVEAELGDGGPRSTPAVADGRVFAVSSQALLVAADADTGERLWEKDLTEWAPVPRFGYSVSPVVVGERVVLGVGKPGEEGPAFAAFEVADGSLAWTGLTGSAGYSTPLRLELHGVDQLVVSRGVHLVAMAAEDGSELWRHDLDPHAAIPMPIFLPPDRFFVSSSDDGFGGRTVRVIRAADGSWSTQEVWSERLMRNHFNTSVLVAGHLYGFDNGTLRCLDAETGERRWAQRGFGKGSLVAAGDRLYVLGDGGSLALVRATPEAYEELGRVQAMEGRAWTSPTLAGGRLFSRDFDEIVAYDVRSGGGAPAGAAPSDEGEDRP